MKMPMPKSVCCIIIGLALIEPIMHLALPYMVGEGQAHTGFHIGDTPFFLTAMDSLRNGFQSPYALPDSPLGTANAAYYALPHHWLYGVIGWVAALVGLSDFIALGLANGLCGAFYLYAAWRVLQVLWPERALNSFYLFSLGGGLAGLLYLITTNDGTHGTVEFEQWFHRFARYELIEGPFLSPALVLPRLYYTLPLALGFVALTRIVQDKINIGTLILLAICTWLNARIGPFFLAMAWAWLWVQDDQPKAQRIKQGTLLALPVALFFILVMIQFSFNPIARENVNILLRRVAWFGSVVSATLFLLPFIGMTLLRVFRNAPKRERVLIGAALGYLMAFTLLYVLHQTYYGNWLTGGDTAAALAISDWALLGIIPGLLLAKLVPATPNAAVSKPLRWVALLTLALLPISISAWGGGAFMQLMPERCLVLLGIPLALLTAEGLAHLEVKQPFLARWALIWICQCGLWSIFDSNTHFQGPWGYGSEDKAFAWAHSEVMPAEDYNVIEKIEGGTVLAPAYHPPYMGDVIVHNRPGTKTIFGQPTLEFSGVNMNDTAIAMDRFFDDKTTTEQRHEQIKKWCVDHIYCPGTYPFDEHTLAQLDATPWLRLIAQEGDARLYAVEGRTP